MHSSKKYCFNNIHKNKSLPLHSTHAVVWCQPPPPPPLPSIILKRTPFTLSDAACNSKKTFVFFFFFLNMSFSHKKLVLEWLSFMAKFQKLGHKTLFECFFFFFFSKYSFKITLPPHFVRRGVVPHSNVWPWGPGKASRVARTDSKSCTLLNKVRTDRTPRRKVESLHSLGLKLFLKGVSERTIRKIKSILGVSERTIRKIKSILCCC